MKIKQKEEIEEEVQEENNDPQPKKVEEEESVEETADEKAHRLELENAELRGRQSAYSEKKEDPAPTISNLDPEEQEWQTAKPALYNDLKNLDDEQFEKVYKVDKGNARMQISDRDRYFSDRKSQEREARLDAKTTLTAQYGKEFAEVSDKVLEILPDLSSQVRKDPSRLKKALEREFKAIRSDNPKPKPSQSTKKRIITDFDSPHTPPSKKPVERNEDEVDERDLVKEEDRALASVFGVEKESERKKYMSNFIEMDFGNGIKLSDPKKGFQKSKAV